MPRHGRPDPTGRSSGKLSGKERSLHGPPKGKAWTWRTGEMLASVAHRSLSRHARLLLDFLECEYQNHAGRENGALLATYDQLHNWGIQRKRISEAIREAEAFGFIKCEHGGRYNMTNQPSRFRLTWLADREGTPATNDWQKVGQADIDHWNKSRQKQNRGVKKGTTVRPPLGTTRPKLPELDANEMAEIRRLPSRSVIPHGGTASISREGNDTEDPSTASPDEPLSSTLTVNRPIPGGDVIDHAQRSLGPMVVLTGGLEKKAAEVDAIQVPLVAAKKSAVAAIGKGKFLERDLLLNRYLTAVPAEAQDGVRALEYLEWANELVEEQHAATAGGGGA